MSKNRIMKGAGHHKQLKGPNGEPLCRWCETEVKPPKRTFCGNKNCLHEWQLRTRPAYMRKCVKARDKETCQICKLDCKTYQKKLQHLYATDLAEFTRQIRGLKAAERRLYGTLWDVDHIVPVSEGGGECGLENVRTLCIWCHRNETNILLAEQAKKRQGRKRRNNKRGKTK